MTTAIDFGVFFFAGFILGSLFGVFILERIIEWWNHKEK